ncbi:uncharacterized protein LY89DRAFT_718043 [Mollisia scopiformis]|uniref:Telomeric single stranded DNA binding POT1/Cdc13 domain-containing protein n=1 Tax=Mollisia scopiformis TaxID=149040 RepID=A0A194XAX1_MOLSC|nr:uncharacterized protein LY89DRAFT_718043 [Mollisia scopiformis]KUJ17318.1 hypothetical protein LY89DRAFT_718043 [Mollisia scopiformis]
MAVDTNGLSAMETAHIPIAQLTPLLVAPATRSIKAVVTLTWPYSSATGSIAFLLSEPDFRLRRTRGQVRVQFAGASAKSIAKAGIASGDEVTLCLDGVEWLENQNDAGTPGRGVEVELKFTERLHLQFKQEDASELITIDIDHPPPDPETALVFARIPTPEPSPPSPVTNGTSIPSSTILEADDEWSSPAFLKRARTSYGSLFDSDYDPFLEDGTVQGKGRKRTRLSSVWRYSSRSPTPEEAESQATNQVSPEPLPKLAPTMMDEACQTVGLEVGVAAETLADFARQATNVGSTPYSQMNGAQPPEIISSSSPAQVAQEPEDVAMPPPRIHTQQTNFTSDEAMNFNQEPPLSPRLHPIPSDNLPLVSPLVSHSNGFNFGQLGQSTSDNAPNQLSVPSNHAAPDEEDEEDIYGASPVSHRSNVPRYGFNGFQEPPGGGQTAKFPAIAGPYAIEDQYGHWQNANAQLRQSASPSKHDEYHDSEPQIGQSYNIENHNQHNLGLATSHDRMSTEQYPEIDPQLADGVRYPELSHNKDDLAVEEPIYRPHLAQSSAMSRSQSALSHSARSQSVQSPVVDLTEDSDENEEEEEDQEDQDAPGEDDDSLEGSEIVDDGLVPVYTSRHVSRQTEARSDHRLQEDHESNDGDESGSEAEGSQEPEDENLYYMENDADEDPENPAGPDEYPRYRRTPEAINGAVDDDGFEEDEEGSFDEEEEQEESYDEDDMQDEDPPGPPVVIDLLSSDDEDEPAATIPSTHQTSHSQFQSAPADSRECEESDEDETDQENDVPYHEREEIRTHIQRDPPPQAYSGEDLFDEDYDEEDQEELVSDRDAADRHGDPARIVEGHKHEAASQSGESEEEEDESDGSEDEDLMDEDDSHGVDAEDEPRTPESRRAPSSIPNDIAKKPADEKSVEEKPQSSGGPSLFPRMFNLDGATDEPLSPRLSYPTLPNEEPSPSNAHGGERGSESQEQTELFVQHTNGQLPTPDISQPIEKMTVTDTSFTSTTAHTSEIHMEVLEENRTITEVDTSTEVQVTTHVSSIDMESHASADLRPSQDDVDMEALNESELHDANDENTEKTEVLTSLAKSEDVDSVMDEESAEEMEDVQSSQSAGHDDNIAVNPPAETRRSPNTGEHEHIQNNDTSLMHETVDAEEHGEHPLDVESMPKDEAGEDSVEDASDQESSESEEVVETVEPLGPTVTTRAAAHAAAEANGDPEECSEIEKEADTVEEQFLAVTTRAETHALEETEHANKIDQEVETAEQPGPTVTTRSSAHSVVEAGGINNEASKIEQQMETEPIEQLGPTVTTRSAAHTLAESDKANEEPSEVEEAEATEQPGPSVTTRSAAHALADGAIEQTDKIEEETETPELPGPTVTTRSAAHALTEADEAGEKEVDASIAEEKTSEPAQDQQKHVKIVIEEPKFTLQHPRRSHRRVKSTTSTAKDDENVRPVTPIKIQTTTQLDKKTPEPRSPMVVIDAHATPKGHDASIELALSSLESPSKQTHDLRKPPVADLKLRLSRALRTELSEFTALKVLRYHMNQKLDILAVATTTPPEPQRAKGGPRHYQIAFNITDPSIAPSGVTEVQVYRPYSHALPTISAGDGILLRNFQVTSVQKGFALRSTQDEGSSWAVFKDDNEPEMRGPPVEYGNGEKNHIIALKVWYASLDDVAKAKINRANGDKAAAGR